MSLRINMICLIFHYGVLTAGAIIHGREIPSKITSLFDEMRDCYMFGLYNAQLYSVEQFWRNVLNSITKKQILISQ